MKLFKFFSIIVLGLIFVIPAQADNHLKKYLTTWIDNFGTGIMFSTGTLDASGVVLTEYAEVDNIFNGKKERAKSVTTFINEDKFIMEMYMMGPEGEFKSLEITHIRKK